MSKIFVWSSWYWDFLVVTDRIVAEFCKEETIIISNGRTITILPLKQTCDIVSQFTT